MDINAYLKQITDSKSPDLHLKVGRVPIVRLANGDLYEMQNAEVVSEQEMDEIIKMVLREDKLAIFNDKGEVDAAYSAMGVGRFRINVYKESDGNAIAFRSIPQEIPTIDGMGLPGIVKEFTKKTKFSFHCLSKCLTILSGWKSKKENRKSVIVL